jgi:HSP20 family protein
MSLGRKQGLATETDLVLIRQEIHQLLEKLAGADRLGRPEAGSWTPGVDVYESRGEVKVVVEVPGLSLEALRVVHNNGKLEITGERRERRPAGAVGFLCLERPIGRFKRTISLDVPVDIARSEARLARGLLVVTIPRLKDRRGRETVIPVRRSEER